VEIINENAAAAVQLANTVRTMQVSAYKCALTFRHRASCILGQAFRYSSENAFLCI